MKTTIAWWDLTESTQTIDSLRVYLREDGVQPWLDVVGLRFKVWISDRRANTWGAVMVWESPPDLDAPLPPNRATELIGYPPTQRLSMDVEAIVESQNCEVPTDRGLAFDYFGRTT